jgi:hypothetical protein
MVGCSRIYIFYVRGLADDTILDEGPLFSECVGVNPTFLAQVISILVLLKYFL